MSTAHSAHQKGLEDANSPIGTSQAFDREVVVAEIVSTERSQEDFAGKGKTNSDSASQPKSRPTSPGTIERFLDSFFRPENIRWLGVLGAAIVVASSLMLVTKEWSHWSVALKFLSILGYTFATYGFGEVGRKHLGLNITSRVLQILTLLLLPICFWSLSFLYGVKDSGGIATIEMLFLFVPALAGAWYCASNVFEFLWRGKQTTFLVSYLLLCAAGTLPRIESPILAGGFTLLVWGIASAGIIKTNRHIFWITEEHRFPRAFGFLPIALLGIQFVLLAAFKVGASASIEWYGLCIVLASGTILWTARTIADVHRQRTGDLVRPLPWNIVAPLIAGVVGTFVGVALSFHGFSYGPHATLVILPSSMIACVSMFQVARDTRKPFFVMAGLVLATIAYQCSPALFHELAMKVKMSAEHAVGEERLPFAFYGLTYLPWLIAMAIASRGFDRRGVKLFADPIRHFASYLTLLLWAVSCTHPKAVFLVAVINAPLFACFAYLFRDRKHLLGMLLSLAIASATWVNLFLHGVDLDVTLLYAIDSLIFLAGILLFVPKLDEWIQRIPIREGGISGFFTDAKGEPRKICHDLAAAITILAAPTWIVFSTFSLRLISLFGHPIELAESFSLFHSLPFLGLLALCLGLTVKRRSYYWGLGIWLISAIGIAQRVAIAEWDLQTLMVVTSYFAVAVLVAFRLLMPVHTKLLANSNALPWKPELAAILLPLRDLSALGLAVIFCTKHLPDVVQAVLGEPLSAPLCSVFVVGWLLWEGMMGRDRVTSSLFALLSPITILALLATWYPDSGQIETVPIVLGLSATLVGTIFSIYPRSLFSQAYEICLGWLCLCIMASLASPSWIARLDFLVGILGIVLLKWRSFTSKEWTSLAILTNLQVFIGIATLAGHSSWIGLSNDAWGCINLLPSVLLTIALSVELLGKPWRKLDSTMLFHWRMGLRVAFGLIASTYFALSLNHPHTFDAHHHLHPGNAIALLIDRCNVEIYLLAMLLTSGMEWREGYRKQWELHAWTSLGIALIALIWIYLVDHIELPRIAIRMILIGVGGLSLTAAHFMGSRPSYQFSVRPFRLLGLIAPSAATLLSLVVIGTQETHMSAWNSLIMLSAAAIYFQQGMASGKRRYFWASAIVLNIASTSLWLSFRLYDAQLYMVPIGISILGLVQLMKKELPQSSHTPLRYIGALTILVSPMFEILDGSWIHLLSLVILCMLVNLVGIGLRLKPMLYTGTSFLLVDLLAMVIRSTHEHPGLLWIGGLAIGVGVIALAAVCENKREQLLSRVRMLTAELATWN